jgi:hypothetical protein
MNGSWESGESLMREGLHNFAGRTATTRRHEPEGTNTCLFYSLFGSASGGIGDIVLVLPVVGIRGKSILSELQDLVHG